MSINWYRMMSIICLSSTIRFSSFQYPVSLHRLKKSQRSPIGMETNFFGIALFLVKLNPLDCFLRANKRKSLTHTTQEGTKSRQSAVNLPHRAISTIAYGQKFSIMFLIQTIFCSSRMAPIQFWCGGLNHTKRKIIPYHQNCINL